MDNVTNIWNLKINKSWESLESYTILFIEWKKGKYFEPNTI